MSGAGTAPVDLTTLSSLRACRTLKTLVKRKFFSSPSDTFVTSDVSDAQNCGKMQIPAPARATLSSLRTCRTLKTVVKRKFLSSPSDPFVTSDVSDAQNCGKTQILRLTLATLSSLRACRTLKTVVNWTFWTGLNRTTVKKRGKMDVFDQTKPDYGEKVK